MANLSTNDKQLLEKLFQMGGGYVLNFSDRTMGEYFRDDVGIDIYDQKYKYASGSPFRYTAWELGAGDPQMVFRSGRDLVNTSAFPSPQRNPPYTLNEYMGADCFGGFGWVAWTDISNGKQIWGAQVPLRH